MTRSLHTLARRPWIAALFLLVLLARGASAQSALASQIDAVMTSVFVADQPGAAAIVVKDGKVVYR
jgi:hypothetical protein